MYFRLDLAHSHPIIPSSHRHLQLWQGQEPAVDLRTSRGRDAAAVPTHRAREALRPGEWQMFIGYMTQTSSY